jgi:hypothetical protein
MMQEIVPHETLTETPRKKHLVNIYDIDGCIMPSLFTNFQKADPMEINREGYSIYLYENFLKYYNETEPITLFNVFITGRKEYEYRELTDFQLHRLTRSDSFTKVAFYPQYLEHKKKKYYNFKTTKIAQRIQQISSHHKYAIFRVFDDDTNYYEKLFEILANAERFNVILYEIKSNEDWDNINDHIYSIIGNEEVYHYV